MQVEKLLKAGLFSFAILGLAACSSTSSVSDSEASEQNKTEVGEAGENGSLGGNGESAGVETGTVDPILSPEEQEREREQALRQSQIVYFEFDRTDIRGEFAEILEAHASYLLDNPSKSVLIEGHTDQRGTPEYNIGLGERRAKAVAKYLQSLGVLASQMTTLSLGEEKLVDSAETEAAMAKNRRAVLVY